MSNTDTTTTLIRWRLILGASNMDDEAAPLSAEEEQMDAALGALYEYQHKGKFEYKSGNGNGSSGKSTYNISKWLGDIRNYFPNSVAKVLQSDALKNSELKKKLLFDAEVLEKTVHDVNLAAMLLQLKKELPEKTKMTAKFVIKRIVDELSEQLRFKTINAITGALNRSKTNRRPKLNEMDWHATILKNLKHYQSEFNTIIPEKRIGYRRSQKDKCRDIVVCIDQSASMSRSIVYSGIFANVMAALPEVNIKLLAFDTQIIDLSSKLDDLVDMLFGLQLGGGTDLQNVLRYCLEIIQKPAETILLLISDLDEGGNPQEMLRHIRQLKDSGVQMISLLSLSDDGAPYYNEEIAKLVAELDVPVFACTPDLFPDLMSAAINGQDLKLWASYNNIPAS